MFTQLIEEINKYYGPIINKIEKIENLISQMSAAELDKVDDNKCIQPCIGQLLEGKKKSVNYYYPKCLKKLLMLLIKTVIKLCIMPPAMDMKKFVNYS